MKTTQIKKTKAKFESNQRFIQRIGMTELEYKSLILEIGCEFLEERYPLNDAVYYEWYKEFAFSKSFWAWWQLEWNNWLIHLRKRGSVELSIAFPYSMRILKMRQGTNTAFQEQYLKLMHNGNTNI